MNIRAQGVARGSALIVTGAAALVLGVGGPAFAGGSNSEPDSNGDVHSNCHTGSKGLGAGGEDNPALGHHSESDSCQTETPTPTPQPVTPPVVQPGKPAAQVPAAPKAATPVAPAKVGATVVTAPIPTAVSAGQHTTDSWTVPLGTGLVTLGAAGSAAALVTRRRSAQR